MDSLDALFALERFGIRPGLDTVRLLVRAMGDPQSSYRTVIVAGTNGKGSVVAMTDAALRAAGYRVGRYTSPHLRTLAERFVVNGTPITEQDLGHEAAKSRSGSTHSSPTGRWRNQPRSSRRRRRSRCPGFADRRLTWHCWKSVWVDGSMPPMS